MRRALLLAALLAACEDSAPAIDGPGLDDDATASPEGGASLPDGRRTDAARPPPLDGALPSAPPSDASRADAAGDAHASPPASCRAFVPLVGCEGEGDLPDDLACSGLYADIATREIACGVRSYAPAYALWSDGLDKQRWVSLPPDGRIDARAPDDWVFPVGTRFWKEFALPAGGRPLETRLLQKTTRGWSWTTYIWSADGQRARRDDRGVPNLSNTGHTVPSHAQCRECHGGRRDMVLGWDAFLLGPSAQGVTREQLVAEGTLDLAGPLEVTIPGDEVERAALGYLHVNCGVSCHNDRSEGSTFLMRLQVDQVASVHATATVRTGINRRPSPAALLFMGSLFGPVSYYDLRPLDPSRSMLLARMNVRGLLRQMPRLGTNVVDEQGVATVRRWIEHMAPERGYPAAAP